MLRTTAPRSLSEAQWRLALRAHTDRVDASLAGHLARSRQRTKHPVEDFLFDYYRTRPTQLRRWSPGHGVVLAGDVSDLAPLPLVPVGDASGRAVDPEVLRHRRDGLAWIEQLLARSGDRPAHLGCFGLHEWAMLHRTTDVRHPQLPRRLPDEEIARTVERRGVRCTHVDAFRFFTPSARPLNDRTPTRASQLADDQPGCLHVTMDLYKWATKASPLTPSELIMDCLDLALDVRWVDMRASPYDLSSLSDPGGEFRSTQPVPVETTAGRAQYVTFQQRFAERAQPLRARLLAIVSGVLESLDGGDPRQVEDQKPD